MFDITLLGLILVNFVFLVITYDRLSARIEELATYKKNGKSINAEKKESPQYNDSVDPVAFDPDVHDYLVRLAKEERE